jgi:hypothetical protein
MGIKPQEHQRSLKHCRARITSVTMQLGATAMEKSFVACPPHSDTAEESEHLLTGIVHYTMLSQVLWLRVNTLTRDEVMQLPAHDSSENDQHANTSVSWAVDMKYDSTMSTVHTSNSTPLCIPAKSTSNSGKVLSQKAKFDAAGASRQWLHINESDTSESEESFVNKSDGSVRCGSLRVRLDSKDLDSSESKLFGSDKFDGGVRSGCLRTPCKECTPFSTRSDLETLAESTWPSRDNSIEMALILGQAIEETLEITKSLVERRERLLRKMASSLHSRGGQLIRLNRKSKRRWVCKPLKVDSII